MTPYFSDEFGNPSSFTSPGVRAQRALNEARESIATLLGAHADEIIFTGSGTESINLALRGLLPKGGRGGLITSAIEHDAVLTTARALAAETPASILPVASEGIIDPRAVAAVFTPVTKLVSIMYVNNEIGAIQPIREIARVVARANRSRRRAGLEPVYLHTDACQAPGYLDCHVQKLGVDLMSLNAAKIGGPKGIGLLYVRRGVPVKPLITGGGQEAGRRAGTENVPGIIGFAKALEVAQTERETESQRIGRLRDRLLRRLRAAFPELLIHGSLTERLPNNLSISFPHIDAESLVLYLDKDGLIVGTGAACSSRTLEPSHVLIAIGREAAAFSTIRLSLGYNTTQTDVDRAAELVIRRVTWLGQMNSARR